MCLNLALLAGRLGCRGDGAAAQPSLLKTQDTLVGKGSLSSFDHFREKEPQAEKSLGICKKSHPRAGGKDIPSLVFRAASAARGQVFTLPCRLD